MKTSKQLVEELNGLGVPIQDIWDLVNSKHAYPTAIPLLTYWLRDLDDIHPQGRSELRETRVRALSIPQARGKAGPLLVREYRQVDDPSGLGIRWIIGNALSVVADAAIFDDLVQLASERSYGRAREMLMLAMAQTRDSRAASTLLQMLDDRELTGHAIMALGKLRAREARPRLEEFLNDSRPWVQKEAKKALSRIP